MQKDTGDANLAHIGVNLPENVARNGNMVYLPAFSESNTWDFCLVMTGITKNAPESSEDFLLPKCSKCEMFLKVSDHEDLLTNFEHV